MAKSNNLYPFRFACPAVDEDGEACGGEVAARALKGTASCPDCSTTFRVEDAQRVGQPAAAGPSGVA